MNSPSDSKSEWTLTEEAFTKFLACLAADKELAGAEYRKLHLKLVKFFDWHGAHFPEECADETINRAARKLDSGEAIRDLMSYCHGVARLVLLETLRHPDNKKVSLDDLVSVAALASDAEESDDRRPCFGLCLSQLPAESQRLILDYYRDDKRDKIDNRLALAQELQIPLNALRSRAQRVRKKLEECVRRCLRRNLPRWK